MRFTNNIKATLVFLTLAVFGLNCSDDGNSAMGTDDDMATINGRVETTNAKAVNAEATVVYAAEITANGSVEAIEETETAVNADGSFTLTVDADIHSEVVVQAEGNGMSMYGYLEGEIENGNSYTLKPVDNESTAETMIYAELKASGDAETVTKAEVELTVTTENAAEITASSSASSEIANSLVMAAEVRAQYFESEFESEAQTKLETMSEIYVNAQAQLEMQLNATTTTAARTEAYANFYTSVANAYVDANVDASVAAKASEMWSAILTTTTDISSDVESEIEVQSSMITATQMDAAVQAQLEAAGASDATVDAVVEAGATLSATIEESSEINADVQTAFEVYHDSVRSALEADASFSALTIVAIDDAINEDSGAKDIFQTSLLSASSAQVMVNAFDTFFTAVESSVEASFEGSDTETNAIVEIMILINATS